MHGARQAGYVALLTVLIVGAVAATIATTLLSTGADSQRTALVVQQAKQAHALAVACGQEAVQAIHDNIAFSGTNTLSLGTGSCSYTITQPTTTTRAIAVSGTVDTVVRKLTATATIGTTTVTLGSWKEVSDNSPTTPTFEQIVVNEPQTAQTSVAATYAAETAGNLNVVIIGWNNTTSSISSVVDTAGNAYQVAAPITRGSAQSQAIYYAKNITGGTPKVTVTFNASTAYPDLRILEYSGVDTNSPFQASASWIGGTATTTSGTLTTTAAVAVLVAGGSTNGGFTAPGTGFTKRIITPRDTDYVGDAIVTSPGSYDATATTSGNWVMQTAAFKAAGQ
jgi:hypothetical protein